MMDGDFALYSLCFILRWLRRAALLGERRREDRFELFARDRFRFQQFLRDRIQLSAITGQQILGKLVSFIHQIADFLVNLLGDRFGIIALFGNLASEEDQLLFLAVDHGTQWRHSCQAG